LRVGIVARTDIPGTIEVVRNIVSVLGGEEITFEPGLAKRLGKRPGKIGEMKKCDAIITVGGDGTVLFAQRIAPNVPVLGINLGMRGFLAEVGQKEMRRAIKAMRSGSLKVVERDRLTAVSGKKILPDALNEVVVFTARTGKTVSLRASVDGEVAMEMRGDGLIVATPTGSTAYALAAGGPLIDPHLKAMAVVPICPSYPRSSPLVVPMSSQIEVETTRPGRDALLILDGAPAGRLSCGEKVKISRSSNPARFFEFCNFYQKSREKLR
jgi:NAD+ kinase